MNSTATGGFGLTELLESGSGARLLRIAGPLTVDQVESLRTLFKQAVKAGAGKVIVDLSACPYVDSAGLAALVQAFRRARKLKRGFVLAGVSPPVRNLLRVTGLDRAFETHPSVDSALLN